MGLERGEPHQLALPSIRLWNVKLSLARGSAGAGQLLDDTMQDSAGLVPDNGCIENSAWGFPDCEESAEKFCEYRWVLNSIDATEVLQGFRSEVGFSPIETAQEIPHKQTESRETITQVWLLDYNNR